LFLRESGISGRLLHGQNFAFNGYLPIDKGERSKRIKELENIRKFTKLPFILKGIMNPEDAMLAVEGGFDAIVPSEGVVFVYGGHCVC
jgi:hypothetical protein